MTTKIQRWGNSLALRIPKSFAQDIHIGNGAVVNLSITRGRLVIEPSAPPKYVLSELLKNISKNNLHPEISIGKAMGREAW